VRFFLLFAHSKEHKKGREKEFCVQNFITHNGARRSEREREKVYSLIVFFFFRLSLSLSLFSALSSLFSFEF
jgi:hypothetical protein